MCSKNVTEVSKVSGEGGEGSKVKLELNFERRLKVALLVKDHFP